MFKHSSEKSAIPDKKTPAPQISFEEQMRKWPSAENTVLLLLPMSGENSAVGRSAACACLLASEGAEDIDFHIIDTNTADTLKLYEQFKHKNIKAVAGPVFYKEVGKYAAIFGKAPFFSLSNNIDINNQHVIACGLSPQEELNKICAYIKRKKMGGLLMILPNNSYSDKIIRMAKKSLTRLRFDTENSLEIIKYKSITRKDAAHAVAASGRKAVFIMDPILDIDDLDNHEVFTLSSSALANKSAWDGINFVFGSSGRKNAFINRYKRMFRKTPTAIDMTAYDIVKAICDCCVNRTDLYNKKFPGCLGEFIFRKKHGIARNLHIYKIINSEEIDLEENSDPEN